MDLAKLLTPALTSAAALGPGLAAVGSGLTPGSPLLLISDNPETVGAGLGSTGALGEFSLTGLGTVTTFRVFFWHLNHLAKNRAFGITLENAGPGTVELVRVVSAVGKDVAGDFLALGKKIAEAFLSGGGTVTPAPGSAPITLAPGSRQVLVSDSWPDKRLIGGEVEVTVRSSSTPGGGAAPPLPPLIVRTVCAAAANGLSAAVAPLIDVQPHPYGCWPGSEVGITASFPIPARGTQGHIRLGTGAAGAPDAVFLASGVLPGSIPAGRTAIGNRAGFGGVFGPVRVTFDNQTAAGVVVQAILSPRGGDFVGAVRLPNGSVRAVPLLRAQVEAADLGTINVPAGSQVVADYAVTVGGAASAPIALAFEVL